MMESISHSKFMEWIEWRKLEIEEEEKAANNGNSGGRRNIL